MLSPMSQSTGRRVFEAVLIAAVISLVITGVRLLGELKGWAPAVFNIEPGGGGSPLGVAWCVIPFGFWFGRCLAASGHRPASYAKAMLLVLLGLATIAGVIYVMINHVPDWTDRSYVMNGGAVVAGLFVFVAWRRAWFTLVAYGILARIPVMAAQYFSVREGWNTHFAKGPPKSDPADALFLLTMAQAFFWPFGFTVLIGGLFATLGAATVRR